MIVPMFGVNVEYEICDKIVNKTSDTDCSSCLYIPSGSAALLNL